jgi:hypothetical protein
MSNSRIMNLDYEILKNNWTRIDNCVYISLTFTRAVDCVLCEWQCSAFVAQPGREIRVL